MEQCRRCGKTVEYQVIDSELYCPFCGWEKTAAEKLYNQRKGFNRYRFYLEREFRHRWRYRLYLWYRDFEKKLTGLFDEIGSPMREQAEFNRRLKVREGSHYRIPYYRLNEREFIQCMHCGWNGRIEESDHEFFRAGIELHCPSCDKLLVWTVYPDADGTADAAAAGNEEAAVMKSLHVLRSDFLKVYEQVKLKSISQLPDIPEETIEFLWDMAAGDTGSANVVIRANGREIWREPALFECVPRFNEVKNLLKEKYRSRFEKLTPTSISETWLYGDAWWEMDAIEFS